MNNLDTEDIITKIFAELHRAEKKFPGFPTDSIHAASILTEESGELQKACNEWVYENGDFKEIEKEAIQTAAMGLRFLFNLTKYKKIKCDWK